MSAKATATPAQPEAVPKAAATKKILQLCYEPLPAGSVVVSTVAGPIQASKKDAAGFYFHRAALKMRGLYVDPALAAAAAIEAAAALLAAKEAKAAENSGGANPEENQAPEGVSWKGSGKKKKKGKKKTEEDLYALLGLQHERWTATDAQLKLGYRKACLEHHPDKAMVGIVDVAERERIVEHFKLIQEAYETLSDPSKRREFDSVDEFDDSLPSECAPADFFKVFAPAFRRNSRWSMDQSIPDVGDDNTSYDDVSRFYDFWFTFKSWREFPHEDEEDVEGAEGRDHRRWIERNNSKLREKAKKEEGKRLRQFVDDAYRLDTRILRRKQNLINERDNKKKDKEDARRKVIEDAEAAKVAAENAKKEAEEEAKRQVVEARSIREAAKSVLKKERKRLRQLCEGTAGLRLISEEDYERLSKELDVEGLAALTDSMSLHEEAEAKRGALLEALDDLDQREIDAQLEKQRQLKQVGGGREGEGEWVRGATLVLTLPWAPTAGPTHPASRSHGAQKHAPRGCSPLGGRRRAADGRAVPASKHTHHATSCDRGLETEAAIKDSARKVAEQKLASMGEWEDEELRMLDKAVAKHPQGTPKRWEQVTAYIRTRTLEEVLMMVKERKGASAARLRQQEDWKAAQKKAAQVTLQATNVADLRCMAFTDVDVALSGDAATAADEAAAAQLAADSAAAHNAATNGAVAAATKTKGPATTTTAAAAAAAPAAANSSSATNGTAAPAPEAAAAAGAPTSNGDATAAPAEVKSVVSLQTGEWSSEQEIALLAGLKAVGKVPDRWDRISEVVPGKSKAQCFKRFKELQELLRQ
ncbi:MAG: hypothetical protein WDW38_011571 [Sanguina aurantia]